MKKNNPIFYETFEVNFQYLDTDGFWKRSQEIIKTNSKNHNKVEKEFLKNAKNKYEDVEIINIIYH